MPVSLSIIRIGFALAIGVLLGLFFGGRTQATEELNTPWFTLSQSEVTAHPLSGRSTGLREGLLRIEHYAFGRQDALQCADTLNRLQLQLAPSSAPLMLELKSKQKRYSVELSPQTWRLNHSGAPTPYTGIWDSKEVIQGPITDCTLSPQNGVGLISQLTINDQFIPLGSLPIWPSVIGGILGLIMGWKPRRLMSYALILASLGGWLIITDWISLAESLALTQTPGWKLAQISLLVLLCPWMMSTLVVPLKEKGSQPTYVWWLCGIAACVLATWQTPSYGAILGIALAFSPGLIHRKAPIHRHWLEADWPAWLCIASLGWTWGLLGALCWRLCRIVVLRKDLLRHAPQFAADSLAIVLISTFFAAEIGLRSSYLETAWSPQNLAGEATEMDNWRKPQPFWTGDCSRNQQNVQRLVYLGGSSTGGAYQFGTEPEAFFAARIHESLCKKMPIQTWNYGAAERDSHTISRTLEQILSGTKAKWVVLYIGHNDLTADNPYTRLEREQRSGSLLLKIGRLARNSRVIAGSDLAFRAFKSESQNTGPNIAAPPLGPDGKPMRSQVMHQGYPMAVPLEDARENLLLIQEIADRHDAQVILVPQFIAKQSFNDLSEYWALETEIASQFNNVELLDVRQQLRNKDERTLLEDNNHFSRKGHQELANALLPEIAALLHKGIPQKN